MKVLSLFFGLFIYALCEPPISKSYLPPPPGRNGNRGYQSGFPEVAVARSTPGSNGPNGFALTGSGRSSPFGGVGGSSGFGAAAGRPNQGYPNNQANYNFDYSVSDGQQGTKFAHQEAREDARAEGEYHVTLPDGRIQTVSYEADERGFKPKISYEETDAQFGGYNANANNAQGRAGFTGHSSYGTSSRGNNYDDGGGYRGNSINGGGGYSGNGYNGHEQGNLAGRTSGY